MFWSAAPSLWYGAWGVTHLCLGRGTRPPGGRTVPLSRRLAIPGDAANRSRRLRAAGRAKAALSDGRTADVLDALGVALLAQGKPKEAEEAFRGSLRLGSATTDAEWAANNLAVALKAQGSDRFSNWSEAEALYRQALEGRRRVLGDVSVNNLATLLSSMGQGEEAEVLYKEAQTLAPVDADG
eukprot:Skav204126  [mRNA]  locus=scaffold2473:33046:40416:+ [translate_table: standard]